MSLIHCENIRLVHPGFAVAWSRCFPQAIGQQHFGADRFKTVPASHTLGQLHETIQTLGVSSSVFPSNGQVHEQLRFSLVAMQLVMAAMDTLKWRYYQHHLEVKIMCMFIHYKNAKVRQPQKIQGHFSHCRVLPNEFYTRRVNTVARERRLQRVIYRNPTHFRDVEIVCWSVKNGAIPRGIAISQSFPLKRASYWVSIYKLAKYGRK